MNGTNTYEDAGQVLQLGAKLLLNGLPHRRIRRKRGIASFESPTSRVRLPNNIANPRRQMSDCATDDLIEGGVPVPKGPHLARDKRALRDQDRQPRHHHDRAEGDWHRQHDRANNNNQDRYGNEHEPQHHPT